VRDYRLRAGENKHRSRCPSGRSLKTSRSRATSRAHRSNPRGSAFSTVLTSGGEQIAMLPDDPDEMEAVLKAMAPPGATIRVDGFTGGPLPPKSQFARSACRASISTTAQNHGGMNGLMFIDIHDAARQRPPAGSLDVTVRDDALNAKNPFAPGERHRESQTGRLLPCPGRSRQIDRRFFAHRAARQPVRPRRRCWWPFPDRRAQVWSVSPPRRLSFSGRFDQAVRKDHIFA
jgi:hypothetical protein